MMSKTYMRQIRIAFLNTHPIQYFAPLYAYLNQDDDLAVSGLYLSDYSIRGGTDRSFRTEVKWDIDLLAGYEARFIAGAARRNEPKGFFSIVAPQLWRQVRAGGFDALVVHGHTPAAMMVAIAAAKRAGMPVFIRGETHLGLRRSAVKSALRQPVMRALYNILDGVLAIGSANAAFYRTIGVPEKRIFMMPYAVDNARFTAESCLMGAERKALRAALGVEDDRPIILYAGKFQARKRPDNLLHAAARLNREGCLFHIAMVGSGELESELRALAAQLGMSNVHFPGFFNQKALPRTYAACDVFVLPSENEPWGLAINEAMCAGLPIIASSEIGCVPDLVRDGVNGRTFAAGDTISLAGALRPLLDDRELRRKMGHSSRDIIARWSYAECREGLRAALASVGLVSRCAHHQQDAFVVTS
jgi:glycosyltransferase involved in cell wall biosynthesis